MKTAPPGNSSILKFFKPKQDIAIQQTETQSQSQTLAGSQVESSPQEGGTPQSAQSNTQPTPPDSGPGVTKRPEIRMNGSATRTGKLVVRNSDSEDSDDSLDELPMITGRKPATSTVPSTSVTKTPPRTRTATVKFDASPMPVRPRPKNLKNGLDSLGKQKQQEKKDAATAEALRALLEDDLDTEHNEELNAQDLIANFEPEDQDNAGRITAAMMRQEAGNIETRWFFFDTDTVPKKSGKSDYPKKAVGQSSWKAALTNPSTFRQTVITGFADDMVDMGEELPDELLLWMLDEMCFERSETVRQSYCRIISSHPSDTLSRLIDAAFIQKLFRNLGGTEEAIDTEKDIRSAKTLTKEYKARSWDQLTSVVTLLGMLARSLSPKSRAYSICLLARLCIDMIVVEKLALFQATQDSIKSLILSIPGAHWASECKSISRSIFDTTESSVFRFQIIQCMPDLGIPRLHNFRRQLSISFFFNDPSLLTQPPSATLSLPTITKYLSSSHFFISPSTDYQELTSLISLLDIAVADGQTTDNAKKTPVPEEEFNSNVDGLVKSLEVLGSNIRDASASHPGRTDAKNAIKVVSLRIASIRTKPKPKISIWGPQTPRKDLRPENSELMKKYFAKKEE